MIAGKPNLRPIAVLLAAACGLFACGTPSRQPSAYQPDTGLDRMERLALTANKCWFKSRDPAFASYSLAPELSSYSGRPRFLLVPRGRPEAKPLLVVEGRSGSAGVATYGPLLQSSLGPRVGADIRRWSAGGGACDA